MEYSVKGVKTFRGMEGTGWECSLYKDGKKIGTVLDDAHGGPLMFYIPQKEQRLQETMQNPHYFHPQRRAERVLEHEGFIHPCRRSTSRQKVRG